MRSFLLLVTCYVVFAAGFSGEAIAQTETFFSVTGDVTVEIEEATATMTKIAGRIPAITIVSAPASIKKLGASYSVNLFFSNDFSVMSGVYPVRFSYRKLENTLGGSFIMGGGRFSHDSRGTVEFVEFGEQVKMRFEFRTFNAREMDPISRTANLKR